MAASDDASSSSHRGKGPTSEEDPSPRPHPDPKSQEGAQPDARAKDGAQPEVQPDASAQPDRRGIKRKRSIVRKYSVFDSSMPEDARKVFAMMHNDDLPSRKCITRSCKYQVVYSIKDVVGSDSDDDDDDDSE